MFRTVFLLLFISHGVFAQYDKKNESFTEILGSGGFISQSYQRVFPVFKNIALVPRLGIGMDRHYNNIVPLGEIGLRLSSKSNSWQISYGKYPGYVRHYETYNNDTFLVRFEYRYTFKNGVFIQGGPVLLFEQYQSYQHWTPLFGKSFGYSF